MKNSASGPVRSGKMRVVRSRDMGRLCVYGCAGSAMSLEAMEIDLLFG